MLYVKRLVNGYFFETPIYIFINQTVTVRTIVNINTDFYLEDKKNRKTYQIAKYTKL